ncbi:DUF3618 domain-containing protein [Actinoplanes palleronii]|uniref:DUF3618 domain-containing protein n=1 Tax=Actinoplanes palleronii TaxID=113570 RepID=UPI001943622E|nr:DUF3618 domain-containing protein [Actinoplanes palleronii]
MGGDHGAGDGAREESAAAPRDAGELRAEIEQTRAELGETVEALVAKVDVPSRVKHSAADKTAQLKASAMDLKDAATTKAADLGEAVSARTADLKEAAVDLGGAVSARAAELKGVVADTAGKVSDRAAGLREAAASKAGQPQGAAAPSGARRNETAGLAAGGPWGVHETGHIAEATAQTSARMCASAADAAGRATAVIGSARRRIVANPGRYAILGAAVGTVAAGVAFIRRSR